MQLQKIVVHGFKSQGSVATLLIPSTGMALIFGENGCGKTTMLRILSSVLSGNFEAIDDESVEKVEIYYGDQYFEHVAIAHKENGKFKFESDDSFKEFASISIGVDRGLAAQNFVIDNAIIQRFFEHPRVKSNKSIGKLSPEDKYFIAQELSEYVKFQQRRRVVSRRAHSVLQVNHSIIENIKMEDLEDMIIERLRDVRYEITQKVKNALFKTLSLSIDDSLYGPRESLNESQLYDQLVVHKDLLIDALDEENSFESELISKIRLIQSFEDFNEITKGLKILILNMIEEISDAGRFISSITVLFDTFNEHLSNGKRIEFGDKGVQISTSNGSHSLSKLSSGERHLLTIFVSLLLFGREKDLFIVDEPEISLNVRWQRVFISTCKKLAPETQIILATHSPSIVDNYSESLCQIQVS